LRREKREERREKRQERREKKEERREGRGKGSASKTVIEDAPQDVIEISAREKVLRYFSTYAKIKASVIFYIHRVPFWAKTWGEEMKKEHTSVRRKKRDSRGKNPPSKRQRFEFSVKFYSIPRKRNKQVKIVAYDEK
jgi:hypothetical protein